MVQYAKEAWPFGANNKLAWVFVGRRREPQNFFYTICNIHSHNWASSSPGFKGESYGRNLVDNIADPSIDTTGLTHPFLSTQPS